MASVGLFLVGAAPGRHANHDPERHALYPHPSGCAGERLYQMTGLGLLEYLRIPRRNVIRTYAETNDGKFPALAARDGAERLRPMLAGYDVVFMGRQVARAFGHDGNTILPLRLLTWREGPTYRYAMMPHPSGRNRWYNEEANRRLAVRFISRAARSAVREEL